MSVTKGFNLDSSSFIFKLQDKVAKLFSSARGLMQKPKRLLALDISQATIEIAYVEPVTSLEAKFPRYKLLAYDAKNIFKDKTASAATDFINAFLKRNSILENEIILSISDSNSVAIKHLVLPVLPHKEILEAAKWQLKEEVSFDLEGATIDWQVIKSYTDEQGAKKNGITFIVLKKEMVDQYLSILAQCHLSPSVVTNSFFNYSYLLREEAQPAISAVLDVDYQSSTLGIYSGNKLFFVRTIPFSWGKVIRALTEPLVTGKGKLEISANEAEEILISAGIPENENQVIRENIQATHIISLMRPLLEALVRELKSSFDYFTSTFDLQQPSVVYIRENRFILKNLDTYLSKEANMQVINLPIPSMIQKAQQEGDKEERLEKNILNALAAVLANPSVINLLPAEVKLKKLESSRNAFLKIFAVAVGVVIFILVLMNEFEIFNFKENLKKANLHLQSLEEMKNVKRKIVKFEGLIDEINGDKVPANGILKTISLSIPKEIILTELTLDESGHSLQLKGTISASAETTETVLTNFMQQLEASPFLNEVILVSTQVQGSSQVFEMKGDLP